MEWNMEGPTWICPIETHLHFPFGVNGFCCETFCHRIDMMIIPQVCLNFMCVSEYSFISLFRGVVVPKKMQGCYPKETSLVSQQTTSWSSTHPALCWPSWMAAPLWPQRQTAAQPQNWETACCSTTLRSPQTCWSQTRSLHEALWSAWSPWLRQRPASQRSSTCVNSTQKVTPLTRRSWRFNKVNQGAEKGLDLL